MTVWTTTYAGLSDCPTLNTDGLARKKKLADKAGLGAA
jgi:hypothetical protein